MTFDPQVQNRARQRWKQAVQMTFLTITIRLGVLLLVAYIARHLPWDVLSSWLKFVLIVTLTLGILSFIEFLLLSWEVAEEERQYSSKNERRRFGRPIITDLALSLGLGLVLLSPLVILGKDWYLATFSYALFQQVQWFWRLRLLHGHRLKSAPAEIQNRAKELAQRAKVDPVKISVLAAPRGDRGLAMYVFAFGGLVDRIFLSERTIAELTPAELDAVLAHELGHKRLIPVYVLTIPHLIVIPIACISLFVVPVLAKMFGINAELEALPLLVLVYETCKVMASPITCAISRWLERKADLTAIKITGNPATFAQAIIKLYDMSLIYASPSRWWMWLFGTHPSGADRVRYALEFIPFDKAR